MRPRVDVVLSTAQTTSKLSGEVLPGMLISGIIVLEASVQMEEQATATSAVLTRIRNSL
jgi:hypothetical protein